MYKEKLKAAKQRLSAISQSGGAGLEKPLAEVLGMIDELELAINNDSATIPKLFEDIGSRVNLMAVKGELILAEVEFHRED